MSKMKILITISRAWLGGHVLSAFTTARYLHKAGHEVIFAGARDKMTPVIRQKFLFHEVEIPIHHGERESYFTWKSIRAVRMLRKIIKEENVDIVHAFDARSYVHAFPASLLERKPITCTACGGKDPYYNIPLARKICVFSDEQKAKLIDQYKWQSEAIEVIRNRVEVDQNKAPHADFPNFFKSVELNFKNPTLMMISSFGKQASILYVFRAFEQLVRQGLNLQMVFIGGKGDFFLKMIARGEVLNQWANRRAVVFLGPIHGAYKLLQNATIVIGVGRSAFEGMMYEKPTIIVGENGCAGLVSEETIPDLAFYNFSGRNQKIKTHHEMLSHLIKQLLGNKLLCVSCGKAGKKFIENEIDVEKGIPRIERMYWHNMESYDARFHANQWYSFFKILIPIWRDNWWHTFGMPLKKMLGIIK